MDVVMPFYPTFVTDGSIGFVGQVIGQATVDQYVPASRRTEQSLSTFDYLFNSRNGVLYEMDKNSDKNAVFGFQIRGKFNPTFITKEPCLNLTKALPYICRANMTQCIDSYMLTRKLNNKYLTYLFLETFIFINLLCSNFTKGSVSEVKLHRNSSYPYRLFVTFCDRRFECGLDFSSQSMEGDLCSNLKCSRTINCSKKFTNSIGKILGSKIRCNISETKLDENKAGISRSNVFSGNMLKQFHIQRRLFSKPNKAHKDDSKSAKVHGIKLDNVTHIPREPFNHTEFLGIVNYLKQIRSKDPIWAMFSIMTLMVILVWAMWCCGMRKINSDKYINVTVDEHFHYVSMREILRSKKKYLSKKILKLKRQMHRKHKYRRLKEQKLDIEKCEQDIVSDNSEEERLIYANDF